MKKAIILLFTLALNCSCIENVDKLQSEILGKEVTIPTKLKKLTNSGRDTIAEKSDYTFVVYVDSLECSTCNIFKLGIWDGVLSYAKKKGINIAPMFIFYPQKDAMNDIENAYRISRLHYPIYLDENGEFKNDNPKISSRVVFHSIMMDSHNKVVFVGNPCMNSMVYNEFLKKIDNLCN